MGFIAHSDYVKVVAGLVEAADNYRFRSAIVIVNHIQLLRYGMHLLKQKEKFNSGKQSGRIRSKRVNHNTSGWRGTGTGMRPVLKIIVARR